MDTAGPPTLSIRTPRLELVLLGEEALSALAGGDRAAASRLQGLDLAPEFPASDGSDDYLLEVQLSRIREQPAERAWCIRAMVLHDGGAMIGHCGFHGPPSAVGRAEIGYTVFPDHRGRGYATEAAAALVAWAWQQGERTVFASVAPTNRASLAVVRRLGFVETGVQMDEIDGEEFVFELTNVERDGSTRAGAAAGGR